MAQDNARIMVVVGELAELGRRIAKRAGELAQLAEKTRRASVDTSVDSAQTDAALTVATVAAELATLASVGVSGGSSRIRTLRASSTKAPVKPAMKPAMKPVSAARGTASRRAKQSRPPRAKPRDARHRLRALGPMVVSIGAHILVLFSLAIMFVAEDGAAKVQPIILDMAAKPTLEEPLAIDIAVPEEPSIATEELEEQLAPLPAWEAVATDSTPVEELPNDALADALPADRLPAFATDASALASLTSGDLLGEIGGGEIGGGGGTAAGKRAATFFGRAGQGRSVCFICDNSNSHRDGGFHVVLDEVARAVDSLLPEQSFFVVFFSDAAYPLFHPAQVDSLQLATTENKQRLRAWLGTVEMCSGGQGIHEAVRLVGAISPDVVYLLSDGEFAASVVDRISAADFGAAVVHSLGMQQTLVDRRTGQVDPDRIRQQQGFNHNLTAIATAHGGTFTPVIPPAVAAAVERMRPIPRNRSRGAVWGLKL